MRWPSATAQLITAASRLGDGARPTTARRLDRNSEQRQDRDHHDQTRRGHAPA